MVGRVVDGIVAMDINKDGTITNSEITISHPSSVLNVFPLNNLLSPTGSWTSQSIQSTLVAQYDAVRLDALSRDDADPYPNSDLTQASYRWWKMFFQQDSPIVEALSEFQGRVFYHNGSIDSQTNAKREKDFLDSYSGNKPGRLEFITHQGKGHTLSTDPLWGPIDDDSMATLIESFEIIKDEL